MTARMLVLSLGAIAAFAGPSLANDGTLPLRVKVNFQFRLKFEHHAIQPAQVAPWYMWWPADANETLAQHDFQTSPYPTWPGPQANGAATYAAPQPQFQAPAAPRQVQYQSNQYQPYQYQPIPYQPVGYPPAQIPSYWYGR